MLSGMPAAKAAEPVEAGAAATVTLVAAGLSGLAQPVVRPVKAHMIILNSFISCLPLNNHRYCPEFQRLALSGFAGAADRRVERRAGRPG